MHRPVSLSLCACFVLAAFLLPVSAQAAGYALSFNGSSNYVSISDSVFPSGAAARTISIWFKTSNTDGSDFYAFTYGTATSFQGFRIGMYQNKLFAYDLSTIVQSPATVNDGAWHHGTVTYDGSTMLVYLDGTQVASASSVTESTSLTGTAHIGFGLSQGYWPGLLDDVRIYSIALNSSEVSSLYNSGNGTCANVISNLVGWWQFDAGSGTAAADSSGNSNTGTLTNGPTWVDGKVDCTQIPFAPWWAWAAMLVSSGFLLRKYGMVDSLVSAGANEVD